MEDEINHHPRKMKATEDKLQGPDGKSVKQHPQKPSANELQLRYMLDHMLEGVQIYDAEWRFTYVNDSVLKYSAYTREELIGEKLTDKYPHVVKTEFFKTMQRCVANNTPHILETEFIIAKRKVVYFEVSIQPIPEGVFVLSVDITARKRTEERLLRVNRLHAFISAVNQSINQIDNEDDLLTNACNIASTIGGFNIVRIGLLDGNGNANIKTSLTDKMTSEQIKKYSNVDYAGAEMKETLTGRMLATGQYALSNDIANDPQLQPAMRDEMLAAQVRSAISMPIKKYGKVIGVVNFNSSTIDFFDKEEIHLLEEAVGDISFALDVFDKERKRKLAEAQLVQSESRLKHAQTISHLGSWEVDLATGISTWSEENCRIFGIPLEQNKQSTDNYISFIHPDDRPYVSSVIERARHTHEDSSMHHRIVLRDGTVKYVRTERRFIFGTDGKPYAIYGTCHDITAAKMAEEKLIKANRLYAFISALNQDIVHSGDEQELLDKVCSTATEVGFKMAWIGMSDDGGLVHLRSVSGNKEAAEKLLKPILDTNNAAFQSIPTVIVIKTGKYSFNNDMQNDPGLAQWREELTRQGIGATMSLPLTRNGEVVGVMGLHAGSKDFFDKDEIALLTEAARDISYALDVFDTERQRKYAEEKLRSSEVVLQKAEAIAHMGSWEIDMTDQQIIWSDQMFRILGFSKNEMPADSAIFMSMIHPDDADRISRSFIDTFEKLTSASNTFRLITRDGRTIHVFSEWRYEFDLYHRPLKMYGMVQDITAARKSEEEIRALNEKLQAVNHQLSTTLNTLPANIALLDGKGTIIAVNGGWRQFADDNQLQGNYHSIGDNYVDTCESATGDDAVIAMRMAAGIRQVLSGDKDEFALEYPCHSPTENRWYRVEVRPLRDGGQSGVVVMHFDITERKEALRQIIRMNNTLEVRVEARTAELEEANKALEAFSYSVSHDLRGPVRAIMGFMAMIDKEYRHEFNDDLREMFDHVGTSSRRMHTIIDDMLSLAKYERAKLEPDEVDMDLLFRLVWDNISYITPHRASIDLIDLPTITADSSMIQQVIVNLLSNAVKYSSKKQKPKITVRHELSPKNVTISISDNGAGFDMKQYDRLFGAFQRLHSSNEFEGTGIGLLLVKRIIDKHGGKVWAEGKVGKGATFYFSLPV